MIVTQGCYNGRQIGACKLEEGVEWRYFGSFHHGRRGQMRNKQYCMSMSEDITVDRCWKRQVSFRGMDNTERPQNANVTAGEGGGAKVYP